MVFARHPSFKHAVRSFPVPANFDDLPATQQTALYCRLVERMQQACHDVNQHKPPTIPRIRLESWPVRIKILQRMAQRNPKQFLRFVNHEEVLHRPPKDPPIPAGTLERLLNVGSVSCASVFDSIAPTPTPLPHYVP